MRLPWCAGACALALVGVSAACSSFSEERPADPDASGADAAFPEASAGDAGDGGGRKDGDDLRLPCPPPQAGTAIPTGWTRRQLFAPVSPARMYPFAIATDASSVTWVAQIGTDDAADAGDDTAPYNGHGRAVVMRASKLGTGKATVIARDQPRAVAVALDGPYVYWATFDDANIAKLWRQRRDADCDVGCTTPDDVMTFSPGTRLLRLVRPAPGVLFALAEDGRLFRIDLSAPAPIEVTRSGAQPAITSTSDHVFTSSLLQATVQRSPVDGKTFPEDPYLTLPVDSPSGTAVGASPIATDCKMLWMRREGAFGSTLLGHSLMPVAQAPVRKTLPQGLSVYDLVADNRYVYVAAANAGGVYAVDTQSEAVAQPYVGNVWRLTVDDDGVYIGEHDRRSGGAGRLTMLVKD